MTCDYRCSQIKILKKHMESVDEGKKPYKYFTYDNSFSPRQYLGIDKNSIHGNEKTS